MYRPNTDSGEGDGVYGPLLGYSLQRGDPRVDEACAEEWHLSQTLFLVVSAASCLSPFLYPKACGVVRTTSHRRSPTVASYGVLSISYLLPLCSSVESEAIGLTIRPFPTAPTPSSKQPKKILRAKKAYTNTATFNLKYQVSRYFFFTLALLSFLLCDCIVCSP